MTSTFEEFHIQYHAPNSAITHWPNGSWSLYRISSDELARRIGMDGDGNVVFRDSWPGYIGMFHTVDACAAAMKKTIEES